VGKGAAQFISTPCDSIFMLGKIANNLIQGDQAVHSFRKVPVFKTLDVFCDVVYFLLQHWVQHFLFRLSFEGFSIFGLGFNLIKLLDQLQVVISVVLLIKFLGKKILLLRLCTSNRLDRLLSCNRLFLYRLVRDSLGSTAQACRGLPKVVGCVVAIDRQVEIVVNTFVEVADGLHFAVAAHQGGSRGNIRLNLVGDALSHYVARRFDCCWLGLVDASRKNVCVGHRRRKSGPVELLF